MKETEITALISLLSDTDSSVVTLVEKKIFQIGGSIIPFLEDEWEKTPFAEVQRKIEDIIHSLQYQQLQIRLLDWRDNKQDDLLRGMWVLATYQYPALSFEKLREEIEQLSFEAWLTVKPEMHPMDQVESLNDLLFNRHGFGPNHSNFNSLNNSMLNVVLGSKRGNPISLCVIYLLIARKLNIPVFGVNLPSLFILTYKSPKQQFYINAFNKGLIFSREEVDKFIASMNLDYNDIFYQPCSNLDIILRVLRNMILSFKNDKQKARMAEVSLLLASISTYEEDKAPPYFKSEDESLDGNQGTRKNWGNGNNDGNTGDDDNPEEEEEEGDDDESLF